MIRLWIFLVAVLFAMPAAAHQQKVAISTVEHNPRTGMLEVVHRVPLHDAEHALRSRGKRGPDIVEDIDSRRAFARYISQRFFIVSGQRELTLNLIGSEIDGGHLVIYQEGRSPGIGADLQIRSQILTDIWPMQVNRVNIGSGTSPVTLIFNAGDRAKHSELR